MSSSLQLLLAACLAVAALATAQAAFGAPSSEEEAHAAPYAGDCEERCPSDTRDGTCPPGCEDCTCCPGAVPAFVKAIALPQEPPPARVSEVFVLVDLAPGIRSRVFRPPRRAPGV